MNFNSNHPHRLPWLRTICSFQGRDKTKQIKYIFFSWLVSSLYLFGTAITSHSTTYYVDPNGSDSNPGSESAPWKTPGKASYSAFAGDIVIFNDGLYTVLSSVRFKNLGTESNPITFKAKNTHQAKIYMNPYTATNDATLAIGVYDGNAGGWQKFQSMYLIFDGLDISGGKRHAMQTAGGGHIIFRNCKFHDSGNDALKINSNADYILLENCEVYNTGLTDACDGDPGFPPEGCNSEGLDATSTNYITVKNCYFHDILSWGVVPKKGSRHFVLENTIIENCGEGGISLGESTVCYDCVARNNLLYNIALSCLQFAGGKDSTFENNTCFNTSTFGGPVWTGLRVTNAEHIEGVKITVPFQDGGPNEIIKGQKVQGSSSGDQGTVETVELFSGTWSGQDASGIIVLVDGYREGDIDPFQSGSENLTFAGNDIVIATTTDNARKDDKYSRNVNFLNNIVVVNVPIDLDLTPTPTFRATSSALQAGGDNIESLNMNYQGYWYTDRGNELQPVFYFNGVKELIDIPNWKSYSLMMGNMQDLSSLYEDPMFVNASKTFSFVDDFRLSDLSPFKAQKLGITRDLGANIDNVGLMNSINSPVIMNISTIAED